MWLVLHLSLVVGHEDMPLCSLMVFVLQYKTSDCKPDTLNSQCLVKLMQLLILGNKVHQ